jgi:microcystin-dependent protein
MASVTSFTAERLQAIEDAEIISATLDSDGHLMLTRRDSGVINAGSIAVSPPTGSVIMFASDTIPSGWLICGGQAISRTEYPELFLLIGTKFGAGDGVSTFNLPDLRFRFPRMEIGAIGDTGGDTSHEHSVAGHSHSIANHSHSLSDHTHPVNGHAHSLEGGTIPAHAQFTDYLTDALRMWLNTVVGVPAWSVHMGWTVPTSDYVYNPGTTYTEALKVAGDTAANGSSATSNGGSGTSGSGGTASTDSAVSSSESASSLPPYQNINFIIKA